MRTAFITGPAALRERMFAKAQIDQSVPEASMPPYMESFLAHLRLLIGVPFDYLVPDARLLPDESIRFFYLDRSWTDRLIDGAIAVGKTGTREQAHHQYQAPNLQSQLDLTERTVRNTQIAKQLPTGSGAAGIITGFLLRSAAVTGWPSMDVRAFSQVVPPSQGNVDDPASAAWAANADAVQLPTLRLELLSPSVLLALFDGIPQLVWCEEPHHGVQFGVTDPNEAGIFYLDRHETRGEIEVGGAAVKVPVRAANPRVIAVQALRNQLNALGDSKLVPQTGSAAFAIEMLQLPWRQRFEGTTSQLQQSSGAFVPKYSVAQVIENPTLRQTVEELL
jgi:hypothetical protein